MSHWRAGPLGFDVGGLRAPPDWHCDSGGLVVSVDIEERDVGAIADGCVTVDESAGVVRMTRAGAWHAELDVAARHVRYRGGVDVCGLQPCPTFESFLRVVTSELLLRNGGALFHASSVAVDGRAYLFCGLSGAGKTTLVEGTTDAEYLSDDQSIVALERDAFSAWGTPFSGAACRRAPPARHPLAAIAILSSARPATTSIVRINSAAAAVAGLARHVCAHDRSADCAARTLGVLEALVRRVPVVYVERHLATSLRDIVGAIDAGSTPGRAAA